MTSQEAILELICEAKSLNCNDKRISFLRRIIEEDLEILEILKNNLYEEKGTGRFKGCNTINCSLGNQHSGIDYTKVKEWLENDSNKRIH